MKPTQRILTSTFAVIFAIGMTAPTIAFADEIATPEPITQNTVDQQLTTTVDISTSEETPITECTAVIKYYENPTFDDPDYPVGEGSRLFLGQRVLTGLHEGDVLNISDYVVDIPGFQFFDGWPRELTVGSNAEDNVFTLTYFRAWTNSVTVNYYLMEGADLSADTWKDALAPDDVHFIKMGSEEVTQLPAGMVVNGDAFEAPIEDIYLVDTFPNSLRVSLEPTENVLNVLYTPSTTILPDSVEIPSDVDTAPPTNDPIDKDDLITTLPDDLPVEDAIVTGPNGNPIADEATVVGGDLVQTGDETTATVIFFLALTIIALGAVASFMWSTTHKGQDSQ